MKRKENQLQKAQNKNIRIILHTQLNVAEQIADLIELDTDIKLLVVNKVTKFFKESKRGNRDNC